MPVMTHEAQAAERIRKARTALLLDQPPCTTPVTNGSSNSRGFQYALIAM